MVRTKADRVPTKAVGSKAPHKVANSTPSKKGTTTKGRSYAGGNPAHPRETPEWQKPITFFLHQNNSNVEAAGGSTSTNVGSSDVDDNKSTPKKTNDVYAEEIDGSGTETETD